MSEMKHTPGPWKFLPEVGRVEGGVTGESVVAFIAGASLKKLGDYPFQEMCANGNLCAAAPEMLSELKECQKELLGSSSYLETCDPVTIVENFDSFIASLKRRLASVEAVIRKAEARPQ